MFQPRSPDPIACRIAQPTKAKGVANVVPDAGSSTWRQGRWLNVVSPAISWRTRSSQVTHFFETAISRVSQNEMIHQVHPHQCTRRRQTSRKVKVGGTRSRIAGGVV